MVDENGLPQPGLDRDEWGAPLNNFLLAQKDQTDTNTAGISQALAGLDLKADAAATTTALAGKADLSGATFTGDVVLPVLDKGGQVFNVKTFGAVGDGVTNDTAAIQAAIDAVGPGGIVFFPTGVYIVSGLTVTSSGVTLAGVSADASIIQSASGDILTVGTTAAGVARLTARDLRLYSVGGGGHNVNVLYSLAQSTFTRVRMENTNDGKSVFNCVRTATSGGVFDVSFNDSYFKEPATATVPGFNLVGVGNVASANKWTRCRCEGGGNYFFHLEAGPGAYVYGNTWDTVNFEVCDAGGIRIWSGLGNSIFTPEFHDNTTITKDLISLSKNTGPQTRGTTIVNYLRANGTLAAGVVDINNVAGNAAGSLTIAGISGAPAAGVTVDLGAGAGHAIVTGYDPSYVTFNNVSGTNTTLLTADKGVITPALSVAGVSVLSGSGEPEGSATAPVGSLYTRTGGAATGRFYIKESGTGNTGWQGVESPAQPGANFDNIVHTLNTANKFAGRQAFDTTAGRPVWASGATAASVWKYADGTTAHTPA